jgi:hypothetical protein
MTPEAGRVQNSSGEPVVKVGSEAGNVAGSINPDRYLSRSPDRWEANLRIWMGQERDSWGERIDDFSVGNG